MDGVKEAAEEWKRHNDEYIKLKTEEYNHERYIRRGTRRDRWDSRARFRELQAQLGSRTELLERCRERRIEVEEKKRTVEDALFRKLPLKVQLHYDREKPSRNEDDESDVLFRMWLFSISNGRLG